MVFYFYPRPPRGGRPGKHRRASDLKQDFYPRPPRGGRHNLFRPAGLLVFDFYPRPPRGGRPNWKLKILKRHGISIHALREEGDLLFWLSHPVKSDFYPRPPRGGRPNCAWKVWLPSGFLSTPSARRATEMADFMADAGEISIHALREEGDASQVKQLPSD